MATTANTLPSPEGRATNRPLALPSPREVRRGLRWNIGAGCMTMIWLVLPGTPLTMLMECLGGGALLVGAVVGIQQFAMMLQIPGALLSGLFQRRKPLWAALALIHRVIWFVPLFFAILPATAGWRGPRIVLIMISISSIFAQLSSGSWHAWMADLIPESQNSRFWGIRQSILWMVYLPAVLLFGYLLDYFPDPRQPGGNFTGFAWVFGLGALAGCLDILLHLKVPEPPVIVQTLRIPLIRRLMLPFRNRDFTFLSLGMAAWYFALGLTGAFGILFLTRMFGMTYTQLAILGISASLAGIVSGFIWGYVIKRVGARSFCMSMLLVAPLFSLGWFLLRNRTWTLAVPLAGEIQVFQPLLVQFVFGFLAGMFYSGVGLCQYNLLALLTAREDRTLSMAIHWTLIGLGSALGPLVGGRIVDAFASYWPLETYPDRFAFGFMHVLVLLHIVVIWFVALPLIARIRVRVEDWPVGITLARLFIGNPLRLMGNILMMDLANTRRKRAVALHGFGRQRFTLAVQDLTDQLDSPSTQVREAAVKALGRIGNRPAVQALTERLSDADPGLCLPVLRALRRAADPWALPDVCAWIDHPCADIACEAIRAAGALRDRRAVMPIRACLHRSTDAQRIVACAEALEDLEEFSAAGDLLLRIPDLVSPILKRIVAVVCANLRASPETFFRLLENEKRHPGTLLDELIAELQTVVSVQRLPRESLPELMGILAKLGTHAAQRDTLAMLREIHALIDGLSRELNPPAVPQPPREGEPARPPEATATPLEELRRFVARLRALPDDATRRAALWECEIPLALHLLAGTLRIRRKRRRL